MVSLTWSLKNCTRKGADKFMHKVFLLATQCLPIRSMDSHDTVKKNPVM